MTRAHITLFFTFAALSLVAAGCFQKDDAQTFGGDAEYRAAIPNTEAMAITVPDDAGNGALMIGDTSPYYQITKGVSQSVNGHVGALLGFAALWTLAPPTERGDDYRIWGPTEPQGLENVAWRLTIRKIEGERFEITMDGRPKGSTSDDDYLPVVAGEVNIGAAGDLRSTGNLNLLYDNSNALESDPCRTGTIRVGWDNTGETRNVDVTWDKFVNTCQSEEWVDVTYQYTENADFSGNFEFAAMNDIHTGDAARGATERLEMNSRWMSDGTGRSDVVLSGTDIEADLAAAGLAEVEVTSSQCWGELFDLTWANTTPVELAPFLGEEMGDAGACAFSDASFPSL